MFTLPALFSSRRGDDAGQTAEASSATIHVTDHQILPNAKVQPLDRREK
jgi:hypothetical protein